MSDSLENDFVALFQALAHMANVNSRVKGFWKGLDPESVPVQGLQVGLIHTEVSEVLEAIRHGNPPDDKIPEFSGAEAELADVVIRVMDLASEKGWNVGGAIIAKMRYNACREHMHGGKLA